VPFVGVGVAGAARLPAFHSPGQDRSLTEQFQVLQFLFALQEALRSGFSGKRHGFSLHARLSYGIDTVG
jgi:hypothetical protein